MKNRLVFGVGINDAGYLVQRHEIIGMKPNGKTIRKQTWCCPYYTVWYSMLRRCYSDYCKARNKSYIGVTCCKEWLTFSNFKTWMEQQDWEGKQLDKDLRVFGNRLYSPDTCTFISSQLNSFISKYSDESDMGVSYKKKNRAYVAQINDPFGKKRIHLGIFNTIEEAHTVWRIKKLEYAKKFAETLGNLDLTCALIKRYV